jgi:glutathione S-transferase
MKEQFRLISHPLCPYVQRVAIVLAEKAVPFERVAIDLAAKPAWFMALSPLGKTPVLQVGNRALFESSVILEYLEDVYQPAMHPSDPVSRADHRAWIAMSSAILDDIAGLYSAPDAATFEAKRVRLAERFARLEARLEARPWFDGSAFRLVDAVYGPVFRYLDAFDRIVDLGLLAGRPKLGRWRKFLRERPSIRAAVEADYPESLMVFLAARPSHLARLIGLLRAA